MVIRSCGGSPESGDHFPFCAFELSDGFVVLGLEPRVAYARSRIVRSATDWDGSHPNIPKDLQAPPHIFRKTSLIKELTWVHSSSFARKVTRVRVPVQVLSGPQVSQNSGTVEELRDKFSTHIFFFNSYSTDHQSTSKTSFPRSNTGTRSPISCLKDFIKH